MISTYPVLYRSIETRNQQESVQDFASQPASACGFPHHIDRQGHCRAPGYEQIMDEFFIGSTFKTFCDVGHDGYGSPLHLIFKGRVPFEEGSGCKLVSVIHEFPRFFPAFQVLKFFDRCHFKFIIPQVAGSRLQIPNSKFQISDCRFQIPDCRFQIPNCKFQISDSKFQIPGSKFQIQGFRLQIADSRLQIPNSKFQIADCRFQIADCGFHITDSKFKITDFRFPSQKQKGNKLFLANLISPLFPADWAYSSCSSTTSQ